MDLEETYRAYLACLNERRFEALDGFVHDSLRYNDAPMTRDDYRDLLVGDVAAIPDLAFVVDLLVVRGDHVACRLAFDCTPRGEFRGLPVDGRRVSFAEHVFYRFADGRIAQVWSLIDTDAVRRQLAG
ncbi:ester cyclase [Actinomycetospora sp. NBRC 106375]|uniref:ester cyclase n=1 Tax=Actinomycetospora sp. NBRC 106375 TaxID=3032207 RepID=UPI0024A57028|nr:ester cyclase [Actinomycetospora sp. NBRC 106375]GLZ45489.1 ester cyclase [Actinomycetospora sp. NBRC 106375]